MASLLEPHSEPLDASSWKPRSALTGTLLANRYRISAPVGQGSTGAVYRADDVISGKPVAVRVLVPALAQQPGLIPRIRARIDRNAAVLQRDAQALVNLVDIFDVGMTLEGEVFVVTDFIDGDHLATMLSRGGRLPWSRARSLLVRLSQIIHELHQHDIVLGGLEARHCFAIRGKNKHEAIKIVNTAIFEQLAGTIGPRAGHGATMLARYVSPEQACGEPIDARSDVYSLAIIAYELLTGSVPFTDANPVRLVSMHLQRPPRPPREVASDADIPAEIEAVLMRSLAKQPEDRFQTMDALGQALAAVPESSQPTGSHAVVPASLAASEIPAQPVDSSSPTAGSPGSPGIAAATLAISNATSPPAETARGPGVAAATLAITNETSPPAEPVETPTPTPAPNLAAAIVPEPSAPTPVRRAASIPTHVTLPPGSMTSDMIRGNVPTPGLPGRPPTLGLRLPPPPTLGRPATIPPGGLPPVPTLGVPTPLGRSPSTVQSAARFGAGVPVASPREPSTATDTASLLRNGLVPIEDTPEGKAEAAALAAEQKAAELAEQQAAEQQKAAALAEQQAAEQKAAEQKAAEQKNEPAPSDSKPVLADSRPAPSDSKPDAAEPAPSDSKPVLADSQPAPSDSKPVEPAPINEPAADSKPLAAEAPSLPPLAAAAAAAAVTPEPAEPRAASSTSGARRPVIRLTDVRKEGDASASGSYLRSAFTDPPSAAPGAAAAAAAATTAAAARPARPELIDSPPRPSDEALRTAALQQGQASGTQASLSQVTGTTDSITAQVPRSRAGLWVTISLVAAAGIAVLMLTRPDGDAARTEVAAKPAPAKPAPQKLAEVEPTPVPVEPERGVGVVPPVEPPVDPDPKLAVPEPEPEPETKPGKKDPAKKKKVRVREEPEEPEKDVFDQLREHMYAKKAAEEAAKKAAAGGQAPTPTPTPANSTPTPPSKPVEAESDADKAKETLDRAKQAASSGNQALAYSLAKQSYNMAKSQEALELMGVSACRLKNADNARSTLGSLSGGRRDNVVSACTQAGITL